MQRQPTCEPGADISGTEAQLERPIERLRKRNWLAPAFGLSLLTHVGILEASFWSPPALSADELSVVSDKQSMFLLGHAKLESYARPDAAPTLYFQATWQAPKDDPDAPPVLLVEHPEDGPTVWVPALDAQRIRPAQADLQSGGTGARAKGKEGPIGNPRAPDLELAWGIAGPPDDPRRTTAKFSPSEAWWQSINISTVGAWEGPETPWPSRRASGSDWIGAAGKMFGPETGDPIGFGLGVAGAAEGGGGSARSIGTGWFGPMGHGTGSGDGQGAGAAEPQDAGPFHRRSKAFVHTPRAPSLHTHVAYEVIDRVARANAGRLRACYGRQAPREVTIRFLVSIEGVPRDVVLGGASGDRTRETLCLVQTWSGLSFLPAGNQDSEVSYALVP